MLKYQISKYSKDEIRPQPENGIYRVGSFLFYDIMSLESKVEFEFIHCLAIEDWDMECVNDLNAAISELLREDGSVVHVMLLNLNEVDAASEENIIILTELIKGKGFFDSTTLVGYNTRMCFISEKGEVSRQVLSVFKEDFAGKNNVSEVGGELFYVDESCGECEEVIKYSYLDIRSDNTIKCPDCGCEKQMPCAGCMIINGRLGHRLECHSNNCNERIAALRGWLLAKSEDQSQN